MTHEEVSAHLVGLAASKVIVTLETEAEIIGGAPDNVVRIVPENSRTLKVGSQVYNHTKSGCAS